MGGECRAHGQLVDEREAQEADVVPYARVGLQWYLARRRRTGDLEPLCDAGAVHRARAERSTLREGVERRGREAGRPCVSAEEEPLAGVARSVLRV